MYECEECQGDSNHSKYHIPIVDESEGKKVLLHLECCPKENLIKLLREKVESEKMFFDEALNLAKNMSAENIERFEKKFGTYEEIKQGIKIDKLVEILAIVDQLKTLS